MRIGSWDTTQRVLVVAEIGNNHEGDVGRATEMIHRAAAAGAGAVKFQTLRPDGLVSADQADRRRQLGRFTLPDDAWERLAGVARQADVLFLSTPFDLRAVALLDPLVPAFKVASGDLTFLPLLDAVAGTAKPVLLSTGMATMAEVAAGVRRVQDGWPPETAPGLALLHCVSCYPTPPAAAGLRRLRRLTQLHTTLGYSDHTIGAHAAPLAVALGARVIEKHFTLDKRQSDYRDHQLSADPAELAALVAGVRASEQLLAADGDVAACEQAARQAVRRSVAAARSLPAGTTIGADDLTWLRPATGLAPGREDLLIGATTRRAVRAGHLFDPADVGRSSW